MFGKGDFGKVELGSKQNATSVMALSGYTIAMGSGDDWFTYANLNPENYNGKGAYNGEVIGYWPFLGGITADNNKLEHARTVSYYTPSVNGIQLGFSYTPDSANTGDGGLKGNNTNTTTLYDKFDNYNAITANVRVKNLYGAGITLDHKFSDDASVLLGAGLEQGTSAAKDDNGKRIKLTDHKLYNFGAVLTFGKVSLAGSYTDLGKSLTSPNYYFDKRKNSIYTGAIAYETGPIGLSLTYMRNDKLANKLDSYTLGTQYKMAPGLMPYFEVTKFNLKNRGYDMTTPINPVKLNKKQDGMIYMFGTKVSF